MTYVTKNMFCGTASESYRPSMRLYASNELVDVAPHASVASNSQANVPGITCQPSSRWSEKAAEWAWRLSPTHLAREHHVGMGEPWLLPGSWGRRDV